VKPSEGRMNKLYPELTARERAVLILRASKEDKTEDARVRMTMPEGQVREFNRYIDLMNGANGLGAPIVGLRTLVGQLGLRLGWLSALDLWAIHVAELAAYIACETKEPITESEHRRRLEAARDEMVPVDELAELLGERHEGWGEDEMESDGAERRVSDAAWERFVGDKRKQLAGLVGEGALRGTGKRAKLRVNAGSFYDWSGKKVPVWPDWGFEFEVLPDSDEERVERLRRGRERARRSVLGSPSIALALGDKMPGLGRRPTGESAGDDIASALEERIRDEARARWGELTALDSVVTEIATAFDGEDPLQPDIRVVLEGTRKRLEELTEEIGRRLGYSTAASPTLTCCWPRDRSRGCYRTADDSLPSDGFPRRPLPPGIEGSAHTFWEEKRFDPGLSKR